MAFSAPAFGPAITTPQRDLDPREIELLKLSAAGFCNAEIGIHVHLAEGTVDNAFTHIFAALGVTKRIAAIVVAHQRRIIDLDTISVPTA